MITASQYIVFSFGLYIILIGFLMLFKPGTAREILKKAGSTNFINYAEISLRLLPASALILYADYARFPEFFQMLGWFMLLTSFVLYFVPRRLHHGYSLHCAALLKPTYIRLIAPFSFLFGALLIYGAT